MSYGARARSRARRTINSALGRLSPEAAELHRLRHELDLDAKHRVHIEERLHLAEYTVDRLKSYGLVDPLMHQPETFARWLTWRPPGHFYSPVPSLPELEARADTLWPNHLPETLPGIDLRAEAQLQTFADIARFAGTLEVAEHPTDRSRYFSDNVAYGIGDALTLHGMLRLATPARVIEIGSGYSSAMTLDTVERFLDGKTELTFIEPYPELLESLLRPSDREHVTIVPKSLQDVPIETFTALEAGDILFIDSTHVLKTGSDVIWLYNEILPRLNAGVIIHIHDIFYPFEYPREWVLEGRAWGEAYMVRAFLAFNTDYQILLFNSWLKEFHLDAIAELLPAMMANTGGALWLRRTVVSQ
jgi:predicted O-methyltransferase YrrM